MPSWWPLISCALTCSQALRMPLTLLSSSERTHSGAELREHARPVTGELGSEPEPGRRLLGPAPELLLRRQAVPGRVELDGREPLGIEAEELLRIGPGRVETGLPRRIRPARSADMHPG